MRKFPRPKDYIKFTSSFSFVIDEDFVPASNHANFIKSLDVPKGTLMEIFKVQLYPLSDNRHYSRSEFIPYELYVVLDDEALFDRPVILKFDYETHHKKVEIIHHDSPAFVALFSK